MRPFGTLLRLGPAIAYVALVFVLGLLPAPPGPPEVTYGDKIGHALAFGAMVVIWLPALRALLPRGDASVRRGAALALLVALGGLLELVQSQFPPRSMDLWDFISDVFGAVLATAAAAFVAQQRSRRGGAETPIPS